MHTTSTLKRGKDNMFQMLYAFLVIIVTVVRKWILEAG